MKYLLLITTLILASPAMAEEYHVVQGDVLTIHKQMPDGEITLTCFDKQWPVKREKDGTVWAWIGVDLKTAAGDYPIRWKSGAWQRQEKLTVVKGEFRISRITVEEKMAEFDKPTLERIYRDQRTLKRTYTTPVDASPFIHITRMPTEGIETTPFGAQRYVNGVARSPHSGIDIAAPEGTPVITPLAGRVLVVSEMYLNGNTIAIGHGSGLVSVFSHLKQANVKQGDWVEAGSLIGEVGMSGRATGPHLHWGLRFNEARINPASIVRLQKTGGDK